MRKVNTPLNIITSGICCPIGYCTDAAIAAINARLNFVHHINIHDNNAEKIKGSTIKDCKSSGIFRIKEIFDAALEQCITEIPYDKIHNTCLFIIMDQDKLEQSKKYTECLINDKFNFHSKSKIFFAGKGIIANVLQLSKDILHTNEVEYVIISAVDSLIDPETVLKLIRNNRLITSYNGDGFIPSESAAAILISTNRIANVKIISFGYDKEENNYNNSFIANKGKGLTSSVKKALECLNINLSQTECNYHTCSGELYFAKEMSVMLSRCLDINDKHYKTYTISSFVGEIGAAASTLTLAYLSRCQNKHSIVLVNSSDDLGNCSACIVDCGVKNENEYFLK